MSEGSAKIKLADIADIVTTPFNGQLPLIVGGQAVNIWAVVYAPKVGNALRSHEPFVSKDIDLYGPKEILHGLSKKYGTPVVPSPPRLPSIGQVIISKGNQKIKVELLTGVKGLRHIGEENAVELTVQGVKLRVLDPVSCLKAKIANAASLDQGNRQDVKHVNIMKICAGEYAKDFIAGGEKQIFSQRAIVNLLNDLLGAVTGFEAQKVTQKWKITFDEVMPMETIRSSTLGKVKNFLLYGLRQKFPVSQAGQKQGEIKM